MGAWAVCSICRKDIVHGGVFFRCAISTCNSGKTKLAFCSVECWDAHLPAVRHKNPSCFEERAPKTGRLVERPE